MTRSILAEISFIKLRFFRDIVVKLSDFLLSMLDRVCSASELPKTEERTRTEMQLRTISFLLAFHSRKRT